jgi:hypothetical protein
VLTTTTYQCNITDAVAGTTDVTNISESANASLTSDVTTDIAKRKKLKQTTIAMTANTAPNHLTNNALEPTLLTTQAGLVGNPRAAQNDNGSEQTLTKEEQNKFFL